MTTFLDLLGAGLLIAAAYLGFTAIGRACALAGVLALAASWRASR